MICRDPVSEFCRRCNLYHALLGFYPNRASVLTDFTVVIFRIMSEHIVVLRWLGTDDTFLTHGIFFQSVYSRIGGNRGKFLITRLFFDNFMRRVAPSCRS